MKKQVSFITGLLLLVFTQSFGQSPDAFKYQTIARDNTGNIIPNTKVSFQMSILQGSITGPVSYEETDTVTTNQFGLANLAIGNGKVVSGTITAINWGNGPYYLQIEFDPTGGNSYTLMGISQLLSVPYALFAQSAGTAANSSPIKDSAWTLFGNAGTTPGTNFIGTTDANALEFKVNNAISGYIDDNAATGMTSLGYEALSVNTGINNNAFGYQALTANTSGTENTANGAYALNRNTTGFWNTANGGSALYFNTTGVRNVANGVNALTRNTSGQDNTANGADALFLNTTGSNNTTNGYLSLQANTTGSSNTANGAYALYSNTADANTATGDSALYNNTTGIDNTASGYSALSANTNGNSNVAIGFNALSTSDASSNTAVGADALLNDNLGSSNTGVGNSALRNTGTGSNNTGLGFSAGPNSAILANTTALGSNATTTVSNSVVVGDAAVTSIGGYANWSNLSDSRFKNNIQQNIPGLNFIMKLQPITYNLDVRKLNAFLGVNDKDDASIDKKTSITYSGFLAQDVEQAAKEINYDFSGVIKPESEKDHYKMSYADFVVPLVKAVQEQQQIIDSLKKQNEDMLKRIEQLEKTSK